MAKRAQTFVGAACGKGHNGERYLTSGMCVQCSTDWYQRNKEKKALQYLQSKDQIKERKAARAKQYYAENKDRLLAQQKQYYQDNKDKWHLKAHKRRAGGLPSHVSIKDLAKLNSLQQGKCAVCRQELLKHHLDHIVPISRGGKHEFGNLQLLCPSCNLTKHAKDPVTFMQSKGYLL